MSNLKDRILEELGYSDLSSHQLAARLKMGVSILKPILKALEEEEIIKYVDQNEERVWRLP